MLRDELELVARFHAAWPERRQEIRARHVHVDERCEPIAAHAKEPRVTTPAEHETSETAMRVAPDRVQSPCWLADCLIALEVTAPSHGSTVAGVAGHENTPEGSARLHDMTALEISFAALSASTRESITLSAKLSVVMEPPTRLLTLMVVVTVSIVPPEVTTLLHMPSTR